jgi:DNA sulfur modification protein DndE
MLPNRVTLSKVATDKFRNLKGLTGLTPNILARIAIMLAIRDGSSLRNAAVADLDGQVLNRDVLFGEHAAVYEAIINQYVSEQAINESPAEVITALVEVGAHKMGHIRSLVDVANLAVAAATPPSPTSPGSSAGPRPSP